MAQGVDGDIVEIFQDLQKSTQREQMSLPDMFTCKDAAIRKLNLMKEAVYPGKREEKFDTAELESEPNARRFNANVPTNHRKVSAIRVEIIEGALNFLDERLYLEQDQLLRSMRLLLESTSLSDFLKAGKHIITILLYQVYW